jgi:formylglycine-generating enzyme required for sulfatase activity
MLRARAQAPAGAPAGREDRTAARRGVVLKPLTEEEKSARVRALADAKRAEEEARRRSEANAQRLAEEAARRHAEEEAAARRHAEEEAHREGAKPSITFEVGGVFRDVDALWCPEVVVIPPGAFMMGSTEAPKERPQHLVRIAYPLAVGRYPVTFEEYDHFAGHTKRNVPADEAGPAIAAR